MPLSRNNKRTNKKISKAAQKRQRQENQTQITGNTSDSPLSLETIQNEQPLN